MIVEGYTDGVLATGVRYPGPAATSGKVVAGSAIGAIANGTFQWFDINQPGNENRIYDPVSTGAAAVIDGLAPGRGVWQNVEIAAGAAVSTSGPDSGAVGAWAGGKFGELAPFPEGVSDMIGGIEIKIIKIM